MTRDETKRIIAIIKAAYPNYRPDNISVTIDAWTMMLDEYSYTDIAQALKVYVLSNHSGFPPSIGQLVDNINITDKLTAMNEMEAWACVSAALRNSGYHAQDEFDKLPDIIKTCIGSPQQLFNWSQTDAAAVENVIQSNFMRAYRSMMERESKIKAMPNDIKALIAGTESKLIELK